MHLIRISFSNGELYEMLASVVADNRGTWFADDEFGVQNPLYPPSAEWTNRFEIERDIALNDKEVLIDWVDNNVVWADVSSEATLQPIPDPDDFTPADRLLPFDETTIDCIEWD